MREFDSGERVYIGRTSDRDVVRHHLARYTFATSLAQPSDRILDAASGSGYGAQMLAAVSRCVIGLDISPSAIAYAVGHHADSRVSLVRSDLASRLPVLSETIDLVVSFETLEHLSDPEMLISEFHRVLRPGGRLVISSPDRLAYSELSGYVNPYHLRELSRKELLAALSRFFAIERVYGQGRRISNVLIGRLRLALKRSLPLGAVSVGKRLILATEQMRPRVNDSELRPISGRALYPYVVVLAAKN